MTNHFLLIDATWQEAHKIYRQSQYLQQLPLLELATQADSSYQLRKNQASGQLSTIETAAALLNDLGSAAAARQLEQQFEAFQRCYLASQSNHAP